MEAHIQALRINRNPLNLVLGTKRKLGLRISYMEAALKGFYLNSIETGVHPQKLTRLPVSYTHLDVYKRQILPCSNT